MHLRMHLPCTYHAPWAYHYHAGHTHQRMAREHGDLSADVEDPEKDWAEKGLTYQAFEAMKPAFVGGLSSRCVVGESGPMHLVRQITACSLRSCFTLVGILI
jgi:hypothetical protein